MNEKYFSTNMSNAPRCIHDYVSGEIQADAVKVAMYYDNKLKEMNVKVADPSYEHDPSIAELKRIAPDGNPRTGLRMVKNAVSAELMHIPVTKQIHSTIDIGGVAKYMHDHPASTNPLSVNSANVSPTSSQQANISTSASGVLTNTTSVSLTEIAKHAGETFTKRVNKLATSFVDITGINKARSIFKNIGKEDFLGQLETYVNFMRTMTTEWLMLASSRGSSSMDKKLFCCLLKGIKSGPVDVNDLISVLAKLKAFLNITTNILNAYNSFLGFINRVIKMIVASASSMLSDLLSKFYYMLIIPYVADAENAIAGKQIVSNGEIAQAGKNMNVAFTVHGELEKYLDSMKTGKELKDCNFISAVLGGIPLSMSDDLLRQLVQLLQIHVGEIGQQIHISQLQTLDDIIDSLVYTLGNIIKLGVLSTNGEFCKDATATSGTSPSSNNAGSNGNYNGSKPDTYNTTPQYGNSPFDGNLANGSTVPANASVQVPSMNDNIKKLLDNSGFFNNRFGYSGKKPADKQTAVGSNTPDDYVASLTDDAKDALAKHLANELSNQLGTPMSPETARMFIDARFGDGAQTQSAVDTESSSPMAAYAKNLDSYVKKLS